MRAAHTVLVAGGAGYIGSHVVLALVEAGFEVVVIDDLSTGRRQALPSGVAFVQADIAHPGMVEEVITRHRVTTLMHFAASVVVPDSIARPLAYYRNNVLNSLVLVEACVRLGVRNIIFSSSAAVYGEPEVVPIPEHAPTRPLSPYGTSKLMTEWILRDTALAHDLRCVVFRYFNAAGSDSKGRAGGSSPMTTHLIKVACQAVLGLRPEIPVYGDDYPTPDGTCIRDYIHVTDLAEAHVKALFHLDGGGPSLTLNCGYSRGYSVKQVLRAVEEVAGHSLPIRLAARRPGDAAVVTADAGRLRAELGWAPRHADLRFIIETALAWEERVARGAEPPRQT